jgi:stage II sporulation protein GA (sporulation sigma-E factor processing peptidase)
MNFHNGIVYFNISTPVLIISTIVAYMFINIYTLITKKVPIPVVDYDVIIEYKEKKVTVKGFVDTGNFLSDIFSSTPVVICNVSVLKDILPEEVVVKLSQTDYLYGNYDGINSIAGINFRIIPYSTISGHRLLPAFKPDKFTLRDKNRVIGIADVYIGLSNEFISNRNYDIILNPMILN